jgi:hypothetical protein
MKFFKKNAFNGVLTGVLLSLASIVYVYLTTSTGEGKVVFEFCVISDMDLDSRVGKEYKWKSILKVFFFLNNLRKEKLQKILKILQLK